MGNAEMEGTLLSSWHESDDPDVGTGARSPGRSRELDQYRTVIRRRAPVAQGLVETNRRSDDRKGGSDPPPAGRM
jgi:hypothetical protein